MRSSRLLSAVVIVATVALTVGVPTSTTVASAAAATHVPGHRAKAFEVTGEASTTELVQGKKVTFRGTVWPRAAGKRVVLQQRLAGKGWKPTGTATLDRKGRYQVSDKPTTITARKYRVVKAASGSRARGVSPSIAVGVYKWRYLHRFDMRARRGMLKTSSVAIDTVEYPLSFIGRYYQVDDPRGYVDFNLERRCIKLDSTFGMSDKADTGSSVKIDVVGDETELYIGTFALLESQHKTLDLHGVFRLSVQYTVLTDALAAPVIASPRVLCNF